MREKKNIKMCMMLTCAFWTTSSHLNLSAPSVLLVHFYFKYISYLKKNFVLFIFYFCYLFSFTYSFTFLQLILIESFKLNVFKSFINKMKFPTAFVFVGWCYFAPLVLACFCLTKGCVIILQKETTVMSFLHLMVTICIVFINHFTKCQFTVPFVTLDKLQILSHV